MKLFNLEHGLNCVQSGVYLSNVGHKSEIVVSFRAFYCTIV